VAWLAVGERDVRLQARGVQAAQHAREAGNFARADADFRGARLLNPDTAPDVNRAFLYQARGDWQRATAVLEDVLGREPDNLTAWGVLYTFTRDHDPATARRALAAQRRLDPVRARRR
jgi:hypothetical protein